ncbi:MAG: Natural resistance-associated macrophage protein [Candidatus Yanofskybacteria bacterium GW2011_GWA1_48_10]|uniref:Natural resistance-associated macrophage protein n=1 Tax=Candidatus Yanofskybacteria bacterium GW2011_GWA1_48_10 TaxID=1619022 RepID=A0A0G1WGV7_9BACT|nr:MAG: Natural resistance-associated macrophage protein [Candidatus Yanofskybacteria bacterium GW2011_GWA1_48_10]
MGPGLIVGAADDDPSGIAIYALAGAKFGLSILWTVLGTLPFMIIIQRMAGRIGLISSKGLAANLKRNYPAWILATITTLISLANIINIGADISAMAAAVKLLVPLPAIISAVVLSLIVIVLIIILPYRVIAKYLKWVAITMFSYILAAFLVSQPWRDILFHTFIPQIQLNKEYLAIIVAIYGTTISPYLFFWQASEAVEEKRQVEGMIPDIQPHRKARSAGFIKNEIGTMYTDIRVGMIFSNTITFFIMILAAATLFPKGFNEFSTIEEMATILQPLAGSFTNVLFLIGILASGILAIPVLAGSAAYAIAETVGWREGLDRDFRRAPQFYTVMVIATLLGIAIPAFGLHPVNILYITGLIFGVLSPFAILLVIHMANNPKIMGKYTSRHFSNVIAYCLFIIMTCSIAAMFLF